MAYFGHIFSNDSSQNYRKNINERQEKEAPIHSSNVMILDPKSNEPTRIGARIILDEKSGKKKIFSKIM